MVAGLLYYIFMAGLLYYIFIYIYIYMIYLGMSINTKNHYLINS